MSNNGIDHVRLRSDSHGVTLTPEEMAERRRIEEERGSVGPGDPPPLPRGAKPEPCVDLWDAKPSHEDWAKR